MLHWKTESQTSFLLGHRAKSVYFGYVILFYIHFFIPDVNKNVADRNLAAAAAIPDLLFTSLRQTAAHKDVFV